MEGMSADQVPETAPEDPFCQDPAPRTRPAGRLDESRCSVQALLAGDSPVATAPPARRWLLVEQPGPWGRDALLQSRFDAEVAPLLAERARAAGLRIQMIRRPGERLADAGGRWAVADLQAGVGPVVHPGDRRRAARGAAGRVGRRAVGGAGLPGLHARWPRRLLRGARPSAGPVAGRGRVGDQPPGRGPVRRQRAGPAHRAPVRPGARGRRRAGRGGRPGRGGARDAARAGRAHPGGAGRPAVRPRRARAARGGRPAGDRGPCRCPAPTRAASGGRWCSPVRPAT